MQVLLCAVGVVQRRPLSFAADQPCLRTHQGPAEVVATLVVECLEVVVHVGVANICILVLLVLKSQVSFCIIHTRRGRCWFGLYVGDRRLQIVITLFSLQYINVIPCVDLTPSTTLACAACTSHLTGSLRGPCPPQQLTPCCMLMIMSHGHMVTLGLNTQAECGPLREPVRLLVQDVGSDTSSCRICVICS
jgi:hypothetical protein